MSEIKYVTPSGLAHYDEKIKEVIDKVDTSTNTKVTQTPTSTDASYPLLLSPSGQTQETNTTSYFNSGVVLNPSTKTISANIDGNAKTATSADSATKDASGNVITDTYAEKETIVSKSATGASISIADSKEAPMILNYAPVNLFSHTFATTTINGITFTANADGTITANGTATAYTEVLIGKYTFTENDIGKTFSWSDNGAIKPVDWNAYMFMNRVNGVDGWKQPYTFIVEKAHTAEIRIYVESGKVVEDIIYRPMLEEGSTYHTYVPYTGYDITASNDEASKSTSVTINSKTVFPVDGLESYDGLTNVLNPYSATMEVTYATNEAGQGILKELETKAKSSIYGDTTVSMGRKADTTVGTNSFAFGNDVTASGDYSHAEGWGTTALTNQHAQGHYNNTTNATANSTSGTSDGTAFVIGNGTSSSKSNAFRVTGKGVIYATNATVQTGADYAEYFEWSDENPNEEDRVGYFVTFDEDNPEKIRIANENDYILGIVSGMPNIIGNGDECWKQRYILDSFGRYIEETFEYEVEVPEVVEKEVEDEETGETKIVEEVVTHKETKIGTKWKENPEYDPTKAYIPRDKRAEWSAIGMLGVLSVYDDGTCQVNGYCKVADGGIATACEKGEGYRIIKRVSDNIVKVVLK